MKKILIIVLSFISMSASADKYKILFINTESITINGVIHKVGDTFDDKEIITWASERQAMKIQNAQNKKIKVLTAKQMNNCRSVSDFYLKTNHLSTRSVEQYESLENVIEEPLYVLDSIQLKTMLPTTDKSYFLLKYKIDGKEYNYPIKGKKKFITLSYRLPGRDIDTNNPNEIESDLWYHDTMGEEEIIQNNWKLVFIDQVINE